MRSLRYPGTRACCISLALRISYALYSEGGVTMKELHSQFPAYFYYLS